MVTGGPNPLRQIKGKIRTYSFEPQLTQVSFRWMKLWDKLKLNEPGSQKLGRISTAKEACNGYTSPYSTFNIREPWRDLGSQQRRP